MVRLAFICALMACAWPALSARAEQPRRIYLFEGLAPWQPGGTASLEAFRQRLKEKSPINHEIYLDFLDLGRFPGKAHEERLVQFLSGKFAQNPPDLLVPNGPGSLGLLVRHREMLAPGVPIVYCCATPDAINALNLPRDVVGVTLEYNWAETLALAERLQPGVRNLALISGASELDKVWREQALADLAPHLQRYHVQSLFDMTYADLLKELARLPRDTIVLQISVFADASGQRFFQNDVAAGIAAASAAPVYSTISVLLGRGVVGGYIDSFETQGAAAADLAHEILAGKDPATLPRRTNPPHRHMVDANALERWGMADSALPPGTAVLFRQPTLWDQYHTHVVAALALVLLQAALIAWLLFERARRQRATEQTGKARAESGQYRDSLAHLVRVHTVGEMSTAIAHEVNQPLAAIKNYAFAARLLLTRAAAAAKIDDLLSKIEEQASRAGDVVHSFRAMVKKHQSEPEKVEVGLLVADVLKLVEMESRSVKIRVESMIMPDLPLVLADRIQIQQVMLNLIRNAVEAVEEADINGSVVTVGVVRAAGNEIAVSVTDHGPGIAPGDAGHIFDPFYSTKGGGLGVGLSICRAIIEAHGGRLWFNPNASGGCVFQFTLPAIQAGNA